MIYLEIPLKNVDATFAAAIAYNKLIETEQVKNVDYITQTFQQSPLPPIETIGTKLRDSTVYLLGHMIPDAILTELHNTYNVRFFIVNNNVDVISEVVSNACENIIRGNGHIVSSSIAQLTFQYFYPNQAILFIIGHLSDYISNNQANIDNYTTGRNIYHYLEVRGQVKIYNFIQIINAGFGEAQMTKMDYEGAIVYASKIYYHKA